MMDIYILLFWMIYAANIMSVLVQGNFLNLLVEIRSSTFKMNLFHCSDKYYRYHWLNSNQGDWTRHMQTNMELVYIVPASWTYRYLAKKKKKSWTYRLSKGVS